MVLDQYGRLKVSLNNNSSSGWPTTGKAMINNTEYDTVQAAATAAVTGDIIKVGQGTDSGGVILATANSLVGLSAVDTILTRSDDGQATLYIGTADDTTIKDITIAATGAGAFSACVQTNQDNVVFDQVTIQKTSGAPTDSFGINVFGGSGVGTLIRNCKITVSSGTNKYGVYCDTAASNVVIEDGEINATTADVYIGHASAVVELRGVRLSGGGINNAAGGTVRGWYIDSVGKAVMIAPNTLPQSVAASNNLYEVDNASDSDFVATINGAPSGASVVYNAPSSGAANAIKPAATTYLAKLVLHNTTRGNSALISDVNTGTSTITLTANAPANWANGDTITARSQTNTDTPSGGARFFDFEITSGIDATLTRAIVVYESVSDTGGAGGTVILHPYEAGAAAKRWSVVTLTSLFIVTGVPRLKIVSNRFCMAWDATGTATITVTLRLFGQDLGSL